MQMIIEIRVYSVTFIPLYGSDARAGMRNAESMHNGNFFLEKNRVHWMQLGWV